MARAHQRRWQAFERAFPDVRAMSVLDLGGTVSSWLEGDVRPAHLTVLNLPSEADRAAGDAHGLSWITVLRGDACDSEASWGSFDLVYSNSVIEHVGGHEQRRRFAASVQRHAPRHWIQTPYRYFPIEPHYRLPYVQHLPIGARAKLMSLWPYAAVGLAQRADAVADVLTIELLSLSEMRHYFPHSTIVCEPFLGLTKALIAVRDKIDSGPGALAELTDRRLNALDR